MKIGYKDIITAVGVLMHSYTSNLSGAIKCFGLVFF